MAKKAGCDRAWMVEDGFVTEAPATTPISSWATRSITRALSNEILQRRSTRAQSCGLQKSADGGGRTHFTIHRSAARPMRAFTHISQRLLSCPWSRSNGVGFRCWYTRPGRAASTRKSIWKKCARRPGVSPPCQGAGRVRSALFQRSVQTQLWTTLPFCVVFRGRSDSRLSMRPWSFGRRTIHAPSSLPM